MAARALSLVLLGLAAVACDSSSAPTFFGDATKAADAYSAASYRGQYSGQATLSTGSADLELRVWKSGSRGRWSLHLQQKDNTEIERYEMLVEASGKTIGCVVEDIGSAEVCVGEEETLAFISVMAQPFFFEKNDDMPERMVTEIAGRQAECYTLTRTGSDLYTYEACYGEAGELLKAAFTFGRLISSLTATSIDSVVADDDLVLPYELVTPSP